MLKLKKILRKIFWEEDLTSENQECITVVEECFGTRKRSR